MSVSFTAGAIAKILLVVGVAGGMFIGGCVSGRHAGDNEVRALKLERAEELARLAQQAAEASEKARAAEHAVGDAFASIAETFETEKTDGAQAAYDRAVDDIRSGRMRVRGVWTSPPKPAACLPGGTEAAGQPDGEAEAREAAIGRVARIGYVGDRWIEGLQQSLIQCLALHAH